MRGYETLEGDALDMICIGMDGNTGSIETVLSLNPELAQYDIANLPKGLNITFEDVETVKEIVIEPTVSLWD